MEICEHINEEVSHELKTFIQVEGGSVNVIKQRVEIRAPDQMAFKQKQEQILLITGGIGNICVL